MSPRTTLQIQAAAIALMLGIASVPAGFAADLERQRSLFREAHAAFEKGQRDYLGRISADDRSVLESYVLWPDLRAVELRLNFDSIAATEIQVFLDKYGTLRPARDLRYRYALHLAANGELAAYLDIYRQFYQGRDIATLDCLALEAEIAAGRHNRVRHRALELWSVGHSQVDECDPVFSYLDERRLLGAAEYRNRFALAVDARNFTMARWLAKKIDREHLETANDWIQAGANPEDFLRQKRKRTASDVLAKQLVYATERLTYRDPAIAHDLWKKVSSKHKLTEAQKLSVSRHIALWTARDRLKGAHKMLSKLPEPAVDEEVLRWRARASLRRGRWQQLLDDISAMPASEQSSEQWRYWRAAATIESGQALAARAELESLAGERSFYGFLAADKLGQSYALDHAPLVADHAVIRELEASPRLLRARELFYVGLESRGRSEWDAALRTLSAEKQLQAAILASRWGWHSRAISAAASVGQYDDLSIRYPLPFQETFEQHSMRASIDTTWAYGIARSESLFMRDVRSSAGAIGLMQLMPATGREIANELRVPYAGVSTLTDPASNIQLGTTYLGKMVDRFDGNRVLATAAYNAGPARVDQWLPDDGAVDARVWIENIPFNETRKYVKRVLAAQAIFQWRMEGKTQRLSDGLGLVAAPSERLASR